MRLRIRKRNGKWYAYAVYLPKTDNETEVLYDSFDTLVEAFNAAVTWGWA